VVGEAGHVPGLSALSITDFSEGNVDLFPCPEFPREPILEVRLQCFQVDPEARFDQAVRYRQRIIKGRAACKAAHEEAVQPGQRAGLRPLGARELHLDFAREHSSCPSTNGR